MDFKLLIALVAGHYLADFGLQTPYMAENKQFIFIKSIGFHSLTAHAFIHGLVAGIISRNFLVGCIIGTTHWVIDFGKTSKLLNDRYPHTKGARKNGQTHGLYGINTDQILHIAVILFTVAIIVS